MKLHPSLLTGFLLTLLLMPALLAGPCAAAFLPGNSITLESDGMTWSCEERITDDEAAFFRALIDREAGNNDGFVNAWEILKIELLFRDKIEKSIESKPDVKLNGSFEVVEVRDVEFWLPAEALGRTTKNSAIMNRVSVTYSFKEKPIEGTDLWLKGTPESTVTITLPPGFDAKSAEGLNNNITGFKNNRAVLTGSFGPDGEITLLLSENETFKAEMQKIENEKKARENETLNAEDKIEEIEDKKTPGFFKNFLAQLFQSPKA